MPTITLNGKPHEIEKAAPLVEFLAALGVDRRLIAVAHNGDVIPRDRYDGVRIDDGDTIEVVRMVGGG
jgi:thiamine biosynthesis protein ThiS